MCGIGGKLFFDRSRSVDPALLERMNRILAHRGPDDAGVFSRGPIGLAHRRLSIIDLSPSGHQPMSDADGAVWITYNGEIYNFAELRQALERDGTRFRSRTDTEVILVLYDRYGPACVEHLRGMFAFALWDGRRQRLLLARDRVGKKPLYYYHDAEKFLFASEAKAILEDDTVPVAADLEAIHHYLTFGYVPGPRSAFRGLRRLPPAHVLRVEDGRVSLERYWRLRYHPKLTMAEAELREELLARFREAVKLRMMSDVPLGAFLSGGIDSSAVVAAMSECSSAPVKTFSIGFEEDAFNELPHARLVAERYATDHHEFVVKPDAVAILPDLVWHYNEPYADSSALPTYYLAKLARQHVTVALNGDAGDENFAGYERYRLNRLAARYDRLPPIVRRSVEGGSRLIPAFGSPTAFLRRAKRFLADAHEDPRRRYGRWLAIVSNAGKAMLYTREFSEAMRSIDSLDLFVEAYATTDASDVVDATLGADVASYLPDDLLVKVDIATMAHGLEARSPMVDHLFMEFAASIPPNLKLHGGRKKHIFKQAIAPLLPAQLLNRPKQGFAVPLERWFRTSLREMTYDTLLSRRSLARGLFRREALTRLLDDHVRGRAQWHPQLWSLLVLELWFQRFTEGDRETAGDPARHA